MAKKYALGLIWLLSLFFITISSAIATPDEVKWSRVNIPTEGRAGNWVLASGSDAQHLTMAIDGTLYAYGKGLTYTLYKSTDSGSPKASWSYTGKVTDNVIDIATAPDDASVVYYATSANVSRSTDAGNSFILLPLNPGGAGSNNVEITSIDVAYLGYYIIVVGTRDTDNSQYGGIYILDERMPITWTDTNLGNYDVYAVAFSPNFLADRQLVAVVSDETNTIVTTKIGDTGWGTTIGDATIPISNVITADIAFPSDYDATDKDYALFVAIDTGSEDGDVYRVNRVWAPGSSVATDLNIGSAYGLANVDVTGLAVTGSATTANLLAGAAGSGQVYYSTDGGSNWTRSSKPPTGQSKTYVLMAPDFADSGEAYAATSGTGSAFSISQDSGITWNQIGLIDTSISTILDLALSPSYSRDNTLFILTWGGDHSLWRSFTSEGLNGGARWERVFTSALANVDSIDKVKLSPNPPEADGSQVVFIAGAGGGNPAIWKSTNNGQTFTRQTTRNPTTSATFTIDIWAVVNDNTLFIGSFDGSNGLVYGTTNSGFFYSTEAEAGSQSLNSIALSPDYEQVADSTQRDETILVGNTNGWVYWSNDNGISFVPLPPDATSPPLTGSITVAFDPQFSSNNTVYAASNTVDKGIYRFIIGSSTKWEGIDSTLPSGSMIGQLMVSAGGTLYATNIKADGGMERCLNPTYPLGPTFDTVTRGLDDGATLSGLWLYDNRLWSIDTTNTRLMTFTDSLPLPVTLTSPPNEAPSIGTITNYTISNVSLDWEVLTGATSYQWQLDYDTDFSTVLSEGSTKASSARLPALELATTYYWRVRATSPVLSPWSTKWSFTTALGTEASAPKLSSPEAGASGVPLKPVFQWSAIAGANSYELLVSTDASFANPVIIKIDAYALHSTAWQSDISLDYDTTYYWKARGTGSDTRSAWSAVGAFTTESPPSPPPPAPESASSSPPPPPPPPASPQPTIPDWIIYLVGGLLLTIVLLLITMLALVIGIRRF